jgi:hypothetical protein
LGRNNKIARFNMMEWMDGLLGEMKERGSIASKLDEWTHEEKWRRVE